MKKRGIKALIVMWCVVSFRVFGADVQTGREVTFPMKQKGKGFEGLTGEYIGEVVVKAGIVFGPNPKGPGQEITMTGMVRIKEWPEPTYERRVLDDGRVQIDLEMVESFIKGEAKLLGRTIAITETTENRNFGTLTQIIPGYDLPAQFDLLRRVVVDTPMGRLHNDQPIRFVLFSTACLRSHQATRLETSTSFTRLTKRFRCCRRMAKLWAFLDTRLLTAPIRLIRDVAW